MRGDNVMFEGAQGVLLDIDHGTYPYVTSSSATAGGACAGLGIGPTAIDTVLGIAKGYATRVGGGPFPTELSDATGDLLRKRGNEFGSVTGRPRRCGWLDLPALRLAIRTSGIEGLALTKLDVLSGLERVRICVAYRVGGQTVDEMPLDIDELAAAEPIYEDLDGWPAPGSSDTPPSATKAAARFVARVGELVGRPVWATSWGAGRSETILTRRSLLGRRDRLSGPIRRPHPFPTRTGSLALKLRNSGEIHAATLARRGHLNIMGFLFWPAAVRSRSRLGVISESRG